MDERTTPEEQWPDEYEAPTVEPLGHIWQDTKGTAGASTDLIVVGSVPGP